jgi:hypothetical protein
LKDSTCARKLCSSSEPSSPFGASSELPAKWHRYVELRLLTGCTTQWY